MVPWREDSASQPAGREELPADILFVQSPQVNRTSLGKGWQGLKSRRKVTPSDLCLPVFYRKESRGSHDRWTRARAPRTQIVQLDGGVAPAEGMGAGGAVLRARACPSPRWCGQ